VPPVTASRADRSDGIPIGELSRLTGVNIEIIRYYEKIKMVHHPRTEGGRRVYGPTEIRVLAFIRRGRELGFGLEDIRALLAVGAPANASCGDVREIASHHLDDIRSKITDLRKLRKKAALENNRTVFRKQRARLPRRRRPRRQTFLKSEGAEHHVG
jgi:MerR family transcriptional regulator, mercuric resistance operon regulatory protein